MEIATSIVHSNLPFQPFQVFPLALDDTIYVGKPCRVCLLKPTTQVETKSATNFHKTTGNLYQVRTEEGVQYKPPFGYQDQLLVARSTHPKLSE